MSAQVEARDSTFNHRIALPFQSVTRCRLGPSDDDEADPKFAQGNRTVARVNRNAIPKEQTGTGASSDWFHVSRNPLKVAKCPANWFNPNEPQEKEERASTQCLVYI
uniref:Uncharacterized protein n=1 Tax=Steinernema glaseri TaxID=37863 RepID=A0A1I7Y872_9BILA